MNGRATLEQNLSEADLEKQKLMQEYREELTKVFVFYFIFLPVLTVKTLFYFLIIWFKIQEDIATLRLVLNDKIKRENELKNLLGISFVDEIKHDFAEGFQQIKSTTA